MTRNDEKNKRETDRKKPPDPLEQPHSPGVERWIAELPAEVRRAYESRDWDAIPVKWRGLLRAWTKKMADELEEGREREADSER